MSQFSLAWHKLDFLFKEKFFAAIRMAADLFCALPLSPVTVDRVEHFALAAAPVPAEAVAVAFRATALAPPAAAFRAIVAVNLVTVGVRVACSPLVQREATVLVVVAVAAIVATDAVPAIFGFAQRPLAARAVGAAASAREARAFAAAAEARGAAAHRAASRPAAHAA